MPLTPKEMIRLLLQNGFFMLRAIMVLIKNILIHSGI